MKSAILALSIIMLCSCAQPYEIVPVLYRDYDYTNGIRKESYWFEGKLHRGDGFFNFVTVTKFLGVQSTMDNPMGYTGFVEDDFYYVGFPEGQGEYILVGKGDGSNGVVVSPSWLPHVDRVIATLLPVSD